MIEAPPEVVLARGEDQQGQRRNGGLFPRPLQSCHQTFARLGGIPMPTEATDCAPLRFSTRALPGRERLPIWRELFGRKVVRVDLEPLSDDQFEVEATLRAMPGLRTMTCITSPARMRRTPEMVSQGADSFAVLMNLTGAMTLSQRGREVSLGAGDAVVCLHTEPSAMIHSQVHVMSLVVPHAALASLVAHVEDATMRVIPHGNEALRLLASYMKAVGEDLMLTPPELRHLAVTHVHDLVAMIIGATRDGAAVTGERGVKAARLAALKADIVAHLGELALTLTALAARHRLTPRSIQMLFERDGVTFSQFVLAQRLARAHRVLTDPRHAGRTISAIAFAAGFGDLSHFNRSFRRRYGATPSEIRAAKQGQDDA
jgi:AraC-like DNA-binding protein